MAVRLSALTIGCVLLHRNIIFLLLAVISVNADHVNWKNSFTSSGLEPATFRAVVYCLNHCATTCPLHIHVQSSTHSISLFSTYRKLGYDNLDTMFYMFQRITIHTILLSP
jgi:hypothetical protein